MKTSHILGLVSLAVAVAIIISVFGGSDSFLSLEEAKNMQDGENVREQHVIGEIKLDATGNKISFYDPLKDPNYFEFVITDTLNNDLSVIYLNPKPQDFDKSNKVHLVGKMKGEKFYASKIMLKCPSKYKDEELSEASL